MENPFAKYVTKEPPIRENIVIDADFDNVDPVTKEHATGLLDYVHSNYGYNAPITSGYRDPERNANAGGAPNSWHLQGKAIDMDLSGLSPEQINDVEAKARERFGEVLYHDAGSGVHLHAANPIQQPSIMENVAQLFKPAVAEASPAVSSDNPFAKYATTVPSTPVQQPSVSSDNPFSKYVAPVATPTQEQAQPDQPTTEQVATPSTAQNLPALFDEMGNPIINTEGSTLGGVVQAAVDSSYNPLMWVGKAAEGFDAIVRSGPTNVAYNVMGYGKKDETAWDAFKRGVSENTSNVEELKRNNPDMPAGELLAAGITMDLLADPSLIAGPAAVFSVAGKVIRGLRIGEKAIASIGKADKTLDALKAAESAVVAAVKNKDVGETVSALRKVAEEADLLIPRNSVKRAISNTIDKVAEVSPRVAGLGIVDWFRLPPAELLDMLDKRAVLIAKDAIETRDTARKISVEADALMKELRASGMSGTNAEKVVENFKEQIGRYIEAPRKEFETARLGIIDEKTKKVSDLKSIYAVTADEADLLKEARKLKETPEQYRERLQAVLDGVKSDPASAVSIQDKINALDEVIKKRTIQKDEILKAREVAKDMMNKIEIDPTQARKTILDSAAQMGFTPEQVQKIASLGDSITPIMQKHTETLFKMGLIPEKTYKSFLEGSHLRKDYARNITPEEFLAVMKDAGATDRDISKATQLVAESNDRMQKAGAAPLSMNLDNLTRRLDLSEETQRRMGLILDPEYRAMRSTQISSDIIHTNELLNEIAARYGQTKAPAAIGWRKVYDTPEWGSLRGKWVPDRVFDALERRFDNPSSWQIANSWWKAGKTVLSPATHGRNVISNTILLDMAGLSPVEAAWNMGIGARERIFGGKYWKEFEPYVTDGIVSAELKGLLGQRGAASKAFDLMANLYQGEEEAGKLAAFIWKRKKGASIEEAAKFAQGALFDYNKVPPIIDAMRKSGFVPFASFPYLASVAVGKTLAKDPYKITKYYKLTNVTDKDEKAIMPEWMKKGDFISLGTGMREVDGKMQPVVKYLDASYIYPFENEMGISPAFTIISALTTGVDPYTKRPITRSIVQEQRNKDYAEYLAKALGPAAVGDATRLYHAIQGDMDYKGRVTNVPEALARILGVKVQSMNVDEMYRSEVFKLRQNIENGKKEIRSIVRDKGIKPEVKAQRIKDIQEQQRIMQTKIQSTTQAYERINKKAEK